MKRNLIHISRAFIAALLLFAASSFAATAQTQNWTQEVEVLFKPELTLLAGTNPMVSNGSICIGETITLTFKGKAPFKLKYDETTSSWFPGGGGAQATFSVGGAGNLELAQVIDPDANGIGTYTATITPDATGFPFSFSNIEIEDDNGATCSSTIPNIVDFAVNAIPSITLPNTPICQGTDVTVGLTGAKPYNFKYTVSQWPAETLEVNNLNEDSYVVNADQAGTFTFHLVSLTDATGCAGTASDVTIAVWETPTVTVTTNSHELELCPGAQLSFEVTKKQVVMTGGGNTITFTFTGDGIDALPFNPINMGWDIQAISPTSNMLSYTGGPPSSIPDPISIPTVDIPTLNFNYVIGNTPGKYKFAATSLAGKCPTNLSLADGYCDLTVRPLPTATFTGNPICEDDPLTLTFTGSENATAFTLDYKYAYGATDIAINQNLKDPSTLGLPTSFTPLTAGTTDVNGVADYTYTINPGAPGKFKFYLHTVSDGTCTNTNPNAPSWKWW
jgi:hypothetical protein